MNENHLSKIVFEAGLKVHRTIGPGLLESVYEECLAHELTKQGLKVERQFPLPLTYDNITIPTSYRLDLIIEDKLIVELKTVEDFIRIAHGAIVNVSQTFELQTWTFDKFQYDLI